MAPLPDPDIRSPVTVALDSITMDSVPIEKTMEKVREFPDTVPSSIWDSPISPPLILPEKKEPSWARVMVKAISIPWALRVTSHVPETSTEGASPPPDGPASLPFSSSPSTKVYRISVSSSNRGPSVTMKLAAIPGPRVVR